MQDRVEQLMNNIKCAQNVGQHGQEVIVVLATKTQSVDSIGSMAKYGLHIAGENRVQELREKYGKVDVRWHFIGRLQTNKVKYVVDKVDLIHSVDSLRLAEEIDRRCKVINKVMPVLIEVNFGGETQKGGISPKDARLFTRQVASYDNIIVAGIMTVMPQGAPRELYEEAFALFADLQSGFDKSTFTTLSMGMSDDYITAIECGANMIRIGRAVFGERV